ncbi:MAG: TetR/AcrR family transcriptional regulator [Parachlamydiales bacterium]|nr:TetR/AcrR family transcriptional regulator [Candidatus Acheromyda pituitae]
MNRKQQKEQTREHLLATAYKEFAKNGFLATKTLDVAQSAGVSHGALFVHFPTREELLATVVDKLGLQMGEKLQQLSKENASPKEILFVHLSVIKEFEPLYTRLVMEGPLLPPSVRNRILFIQAGIAHHLEKALSKKKPSSPIHLLLNSWLGLIHYYLSNKDLFAPKKSVIDTHGKELLEHFIKTHKL